MRRFLFFKLEKARVILFLCFAALVLTFVNLYLMKSLNSAANDSTIGKDKFIVNRAQYDHLPSDSSQQYKIWKLNPKGHRVQEGGDTIKTNDVTIASQCSVNNLYHLVGLLPKWNGPISVAVFAPGEDLLDALTTIQRISQCHLQEANQVSFLIVLPLSHPPKNRDLGHYIMLSTVMTKTCRLQELKLTRKSKNYADSRAPYPVNLLRNVALAQVYTSYVLVIDIDMLPSQDLRQKFKINYPTFAKDLAGTFFWQLASGDPPLCTTLWHVGNRSISG